MKTDFERPPYKTQLLIYLCVPVRLISWVVDGQVFPTQSNNCEYSNSMIQILSSTLSLNCIKLI